MLCMRSVLASERSFLTQSTSRYNISTCFSYFTEFFPTFYLGLCIVWMIRYDTYRDTFDPIHDTYRRHVSNQIYGVTRHIFDKLVCTMLFITSALLRLECTIDCMSGSVGHHQNVFPFIF